MKRIFLSATLRTDKNRSYNKELCYTLENQNFDCFLPQRDVDTSSRFSISNDNLGAISKCDVFISIVNTESPNLAFEAGYAYALKKNIIIIKNDEDKMPDMFYGINTKCKIIEVNDLEIIEIYKQKLVNLIDKFQ